MLLRRGALVCSLVAAASAQCAQTKCVFRNQSRHETCDDVPTEIPAAPACPKVYVYNDLNSDLYDLSWRPSQSFNCEVRL